jgi:hypothetical protein
MAKSDEKLYRFHVANLQGVSTALNRVALALRRAVSTRDEHDAFTFTRLYALLLGAWAECRIAKLLFEPKAFSKSQRDVIDKEGSHLGRWKKTVELAFRKHYEVPKAKLSVASLSHSAYSRFSTLVNLLDNDLAFVITLRNKLAHGQWAFPLNDLCDDVNQEQYDALRVENGLNLQLKRNLLVHLLGAIQDLVLSRPAFERDFDKRFEGITQIRQQLANKDYRLWQMQMVERAEKGKKKRLRMS